MHTDTLRRIDGRAAWSLAPWAAGLALYVGCNAAAQLIVSPIANFDQAELLLLNQTLNLGYAAQPPLYVWLNAPLEVLFGPSLGVNIALKCMLLVATIVASLGALRELGGSVRQAETLLAAFALIPALVWESQRVLTHTTLAALMVVLVTWQALRLMARPTARNYALLGLAAGLALLSKYNALLSLVALVTAMLLHRDTRALVLSRRTLLTLGVVVLVMLPHLLWLQGHGAAVQPTLDKLERAPGGWLQGLADYAKALAAFVGPLLLIVGSIVLWQRGRGSPAAHAQTEGTSDARVPAARFLLAVQALGAALLALLFVVATDARHFEERWLIPMFIMLPLWLSLSGPGIRVHVGLKRSALVVALIVAFMLPARVLLAERLARSTPPVVATPYLELGAQMRDKHGEPAAIVADTLTAGGNLRLAFPDVGVSVFGTTMRPRPPTGALWLVCENTPCDAPRFGPYQADAAAAAGWQEYEAPYLYHTKRSHRLQLKVLP